MIPHPFSFLIAVQNRASNEGWETSQGSTNHGVDALFLSQSGSVVQGKWNTSYMTLLTFQTVVMISEMWDFFFLFITECEANVMSVKKPTCYTTTLSTWSFHGLLSSNATRLFPLILCPHGLIKAPLHVLPSTFQSSNVNLFFGRNFSFDFGESAVCQHPPQVAVLFPSHISKCCRKRAVGGQRDKISCVHSQVSCAFSLVRRIFFFPYKGFVWLL